MQAFSTKQTLWRHSKILGLSIWYTVLFCSILLAFPDVTGSQVQTENTLYSAPIKQSTLNLPVQFIGIGNWQVWGSEATNTISNNNTTVSTINTTNINNNKITTNSKNKTSPLTCTTLGICDKIRFSDTYTARQKTQYYTSILAILDGIQKSLWDTQRISNTLFSITLNHEKWDRRWWWGSRTITLYTKDLVSQQEFRELLTHELWHIVDLGVIVWSQTTMNSSFLLWEQAQFSIDDPSLDFYTISWENNTTRRSNASYTDFVWWYAMSSPYEDFAESFNAFLWHNDAFKAMAQTSTPLAKKYIYMHKMLKWFSFSNDSKNKNKVIQQPWRRPWDTTRMSLE